MNKVTALVPHEEQDYSLIEKVVMQGDLSQLNPEQRVMYYRKVCESSGLNPFTRPFDYIVLNGKLTLYAKKDATEQLRKLNGISIEKLESKVVDDLYIVKATARTKDGRTDEATGAVSFGHLKGDAKANAIMKAETKAKRRVTLSISGMGWTDESEVESIPYAKPIAVDMDTGEIKNDVKLVESKSCDKITQSQSDELYMILEECDENYTKWAFNNLKMQYGIERENLINLPLSVYSRFKESAVKNMEANHAKQRAQQVTPELITQEVQ
jgi:hypothetical protein